MQYRFTRYAIYVYSLPEAAQYEMLHHQQFSFALLINTTVHAKGFLVSLPHKHTFNSLLTVATSDMKMLTPSTATYFHLEKNSFHCFCGS